MFGKFTWGVIIGAAAYFLYDAYKKGNITCRVTCGEGGGEREHGHERGECGCECECGGEKEHHASASHPAEPVGELVSAK